MAPGDYRKLQQIGSGTYGCAFLVQNLAPQQGGRGDQQLVLKEVDISSMDSLQRASAEMEAKLLSSLQHPYIVRYLESFMKKGKLSIVMDYCEGGDLRQYVKQQRRSGSSIPEVQVLRWFTQTCLAVKHIHSNKILHRDIKTQNIILTRRDDSEQFCVKLADFGIAKVLQDQTSFARTFCGTPYYLSPDTCQKQPYAYASDMWALGCVLYELCALHVAFNGPDLESVVRRIVVGPAPCIPGKYSRDLGCLLAELLLRDPSARPSAVVLLQRPLLQNDIRSMLRERESLQSEAKGMAQKADAPCSGRDEAGQQQQQQQQLLQQQQQQQHQQPKVSGTAFSRQASVAGLQRKPLGEHNPREVPGAVPAGHMGRCSSFAALAPGPRLSSPAKGVAQEILKTGRADAPIK